MATKVTKIEAAILAAYPDIGKRKKGEADQAYFERLVSTSLKGTDEQWAELDKLTAAQDWINAGATALQAKKDIEPFPADEGDAGEAGNGEAPATRSRRGEAEPESRPARGKAKAEPKAKATAKAKDEPAPRQRATAADKAKAPAKKRGNGGSGVYAQTQEYVVRNPNASTQDIMKALEKKGLTPQQHTVQSVRGHTRDTLKLVQRIHKHDLGIPV